MLTGGQLEGVRSAELVIQDCEIAIAFAVIAGQYRGFVFPGKIIAFFLSKLFPHAAPQRH
jgi:hypothetical protein